MPDEKKWRERQEKDMADWRERISPLRNFLNLGENWEDPNHKTKEVHQVWDGDSDTFPNKLQEWNWRDETPTNNQAFLFTGEDV